jgi:hypothetical protein
MLVFFLEALPGRMVALFRMLIIFRDALPGRMIALFRMLIDYFSRRTTWTHGCFV